jgi:hypothetical protein
MITDCDCGSTTCPSCGPAQGYSVERVWCPDSRSFVWRNPAETPVDDDTDEGEAP